jgi:hypothetical protein
VKSVSIPRKFTDGKFLYQFHPQENQLVFDVVPSANCYKQQARYELWFEEYHAQDVLFEAWDN